MNAFLSSRLGVARFVALGWLAVSGVAVADDAPPPDRPAVAPYESSLWLDSGFRSHHTHARANGLAYRENNVGIGLEWRYRPDWQVNAGHYRNSLDRSSTYLQLGWMPWQWQAGEKLELRAGASVGVVNGYPGIRDRKYFPTLVPVATAEWRRLGMNLVYVPSVGRVHGAFALQLKVKLK